MSSQIDLIKTLDFLARKYKKKIFSVREIASFMSLSKPTAAMALLRAKQKGLVFRVKNIWANALNPPDLMELGFSLVSPSYLSLESALFYHQCLSQSPKSGLTFVTRVRPQMIESPLGNIYFFHLKENLFFGFNRDRIAHPEKALLDLIYLRGLKGRENIITEKIYLSHLNKKKLWNFAKHYPNWVMLECKKSIRDGKG